MKNKILSLIIPGTLLLLVLYPLSQQLHAQESINVTIPGTVEVRPGGTTVIPVKIKIPAGTYIYANPKGPGIGKETVITLKLPAGIKTVKIDYPQGDKYTPTGFDEHVFTWKKEVTIAATIYAESGIKQGNASIGVNINLLQCSDVCVPFNSDLTLNVKISGNAINGYSGISDTGPLVTEISASYNSVDSGKNSELPAEMDVLAPVYLEKTVTGIIEAILLGIIAGFILNLMPCVLPVVSLKVMALLHHREHGHRQSTRNHGLLFSAGIIASFIILAVLAAFSGYRWGGLFQQQFFVTAMAVFVFAMALSLFGVFTINIPGFAGRAAAKTGSGYTDSFIKGMLATLLATPCSGPFLGGVLAWAFLQPSYVIFIIFVSVGLGMALPYILIALVPALARFIPKPGAWMNTLEVIMGFLLVFTTVYLLSFLSHDNAVSTLVFMVFIAMGFWQYGRYGSVDKSPGSRRFSLVMLASAAAMGLFISFHILAPADNAVKEEEFSIQKILESRDSGKITVVNFTADWCPNCKLVEKTVLRSKNVLDILNHDNIVFMTADITRSNPQAEALMTKLGSGSIPFLAVFPAGKGFTNPVCLRDLYTADDVLRALKLAENPPDNMR